MTLVGATTENPYFEVNSALLSRCRVYELHPLDDEQVPALMRRALGDERGLRRPAAGGRRRAGLPGRARRRRRPHRPGRAGAGGDTAGEAGVTLAVAEDALQRRAVLYDKGGDRHYDTDLGLDQGHARLGSRRLAALPGLDAGGRRGPPLHRPADGDPRQRGHRQRRSRARCRWRWRRPTRWSTWGCRSAPTTSRRPPCTSRWRPSPTPRTSALGHARAWVREHGAPDPPATLRSAAYPGAKALGRGEGYDYPHDHPEGVSDQELMPARPRASGSWSFPTHGEERVLAERLERDPAGPAAAPSGPSRCHRITVPARSSATPVAPC